MTEEQQPAGDEEQIVIVGPDGQPVGTIPKSALPTIDPKTHEGERHISELVEQPAKVMRIGSMIRQLLEEVKAAPLDEASRNRLKEIHQASIKELEAGLAPELVEELERLSLPFTEEGIPSESELRIAQAQLVGWLEGLFHGIQTAIYAQQMAARGQLEQMRKALPGMAPSRVTRSRVSPVSRRGCRRCRPRSRPSRVRAGCTSRSPSWISTRAGGSSSGVSVGSRGRPAFPPSESKFRGTAPRTEHDVREEDQADDAEDARPATNWSWVTCGRADPRRAGRGTRRAPARHPERRGGRARRGRRPRSWSWWERAAGAARSRRRRRARPRSGRCG